MASDPVAEAEASARPSTVWLLGARADPEVHWLAARLRERAVVCERVCAEEIVSGAQLTIRIDTTGVSSLLALPDGRRLGSDQAGLVVNRLVEVPLAGTSTRPADDVFVQEEWRATLTSWLRTFGCPVLNPPRAASLSGPCLSVAAWRSLADAHGLAVAAWSSRSPEPTATTSTVTCLGTACLDPEQVLGPEDARRLCAMARACGSPLLEARFAAQGGRPAFLDASPWAGLRAGGAALVDALVDLAAPARVSP